MPYDGDTSGIWFASRLGRRTALAATVFGAVGTVIFITFGLMLCGSTITRIIGTGGASIVSRVMGMILASVAATYVLEGLKEYFQLPA